jgi:RNA polymerase sigma-70 factor (ECF subfamily)
MQENADERRLEGAMRAGGAEDRTTHERDPSDESLFGRVQRGDDDAFGIIATRMTAPLRETIQRRIPAKLRRRVSLADVLQEVHLVALRRRGDFEDRGPGSVRRWLTGIADRVAREALRRHGGAGKRNAFRELTRGQREDTAQFRGRIPTPSQHAMAAELGDRVREALDELPADYREILHLTRQEGLTLREAAEHMGRSREAVKKLYGRAFCRFKQVFDERNGPA